MRVTIATAGPSLRSLWPPPCDLGEIIAVNLALRHLGSCDYLSAVDWETLQHLLPGTYVRKGFATTADVLRLIGRGEVRLGFNLPAHYHAIAWEDLPLGFAPRWSGVAAFGIAAYLGATEVLVVGADMDGLSDCANITDPERKARWPEERRLVERAEERLRQLGIKVTYWPARPA